MQLYWKFLNRQRLLCVNSGDFRASMKVMKMFLSSSQQMITKHQTLPTQASSSHGLQHFINLSRKDKIVPSIAESHAYLQMNDYNGNQRKVKLVTYGCQMNVNDMEIVRSVLQSSGYVESIENELTNTDIVLIMTCAIREGAEQKIWKHIESLQSFRHNKQRRCIVGVLGCMAERLKQGLVERGGVDIVAGPDSYRDLPRLLALANVGRSAMNVQLSFEETYADIAPVRSDPQTRTAFVSIMRGCDNMCTFCIVPHTRGRERSRPIDSILNEIRMLSDQGVKQVTLLGQNVNSYRDTSESTSFVDRTIVADPTTAVPGFSTVYKPKTGGRSFLTLLDSASLIDPEMRFRFTSPHPKDFPLELLQLIAERKNICNQLHLPAQSGNDDVLAAMGRGYTRDIYLKLVDNIRSIIPDVNLTSDFIAGFCGETEAAHEDTVSLMRLVKYNFCYVYPYSMRAKTRAHYQLTDNVTEEEKRRRHMQLTDVFRDVANCLNQTLIGSEQLALIESTSRRSASDVVGRIDGGTKVVIDNREPICSEIDDIQRQLQPGDYVRVKISSANSQTLIGKATVRTLLQLY